MSNDAAAFRRILFQARSVLVLTGAGISAESGVPTFRGPDGMWRDRNPMELATPQAFDRDPELVWEFYAWRRGRIADARPNPAHLALAALEPAVPEFLLATQNVDGLHSLAGSRNLLEIHGSLWRTRCVHCGREEENRAPELSPLPRCPDCGGLLRPAVIWFGESLDPEVWGRTVRAAQSCQVMLAAGTSGAVEPAASLLSLAAASGAVTAEVNLESTPNSAMVDYFFQGQAGKILPRLLAPPEAAG